MIMNIVNWKNLPIFGSRFLGGEIRRFHLKSSDVGPFPVNLEKSADLWFQIFWGVDQQKT